MKGFYVLMGGSKNLVDLGAGAVFQISKNTEKRFFARKQDAIDAAQEMATLAPQIPFLIMESVEVVETSKPKFIRKKFNDSGELVPNE